MARKREDILWKGILEDLFVEFLQFMVPGADEIFDFGRRVDFLDKELQQLFPPEEDTFAPRVVDKLARVYRRTGQQEWVLIHVEAQHEYRSILGKRMLDYYVRIRDKYSMPVTAFAILTESGTRERSGSYEESFLGTTLSYRFNTYKISRQDDAALLASDNPFALVVLIAKTAFAGKSIRNSRQRDSALLEVKNRLLRELMSRGMEAVKIRVLMNFLTYYVRFENPEINAKFEQEKKNVIGRSEAMGIEQLLLETAEKKGLEKGIEKGIEKGLEKGIEEGIEKGKLEERAKAEAEKLAEKKESALKMLQNGFDVKLISDIIGLSTQEIEKLK